MADEFGPWIDHDGNGCPAQALLGHVLEVALADPEENMRHYATVVVRFGEAFAHALVEGVSADGASWILPVTEPGRLYVYRYRIRRPRGLRILQEIAANPPSDAFERAAATVRVLS